MLYPIKKPITKIGWKRAPERTWTVTAIAGHRILSPACLPIPPPGQKNHEQENKEHRIRNGVVPNFCSKKNPACGREVFLSGRPGSNRPPRPWQGRALPNELLPLVCFKNFFRAGSALTANRGAQELTGCKYRLQKLSAKFLGRFLLILRSV